MTYEHLLVERDDAALVITINRPRVLNALNAAALEELGRAIDDADADAAIRAVIVTGAGEKAFAAGADINELDGRSAVEAQDLARRGQAAFNRIERLRKPVIAAVNGLALGGGCELAMACTVRLAAEHARLGQPEIDLGLIPGYGGSQRLPRLVGRGRALELLLTGSPIDAHEAFRIGLVNRVVPAADLMAAARRMAATFAAKPPLAVGYLLSAVSSGLDMPLDAGLACEASLFGLAASTEDMREGTRAFLEKRAPVFRGR